MTIKAIETVYNGYRFRSRLEARWAVFFDALGVPYEYEREGFDLDGLWYLPDFWLPRQRCWIEIKPTKPDDLMIEKAQRLGKASDYPVFIFWGQIPNGVIWSDSAYRYPATVIEIAAGLHENWWWCECSDCGDLGISLMGEDAAHRYSTETPRLHRAYLRARQARFEHGETPR